MSLTLDQVAYIKATVPVLQEHGEAISKLFYSQMLHDIPELNNIFNHANQVTGHQAGALASALYAYAAHIDDLGALGPAVERISQKHVSLYIKPDQYDIVGKYLFMAMSQVLGAALTPPIHDAWAAAYAQLSTIMIQREAQLAAQTAGWHTWRDFVISAKIDEAEDIQSFYLKPKDGIPLPAYHPGQYISIQTTVPALHYLQSRQYSLSSAPHTDHYRISIKRDAGLDMAHPATPAHPGYVSNILHAEKRVGDTLQASHPAGDFFLDTEQVKAHPKPVVLISAGVGVTPMLAILDTLVARGIPVPISWIHVTRNSRVHAFASHVAGIARAHDNVRTRIFNRSPGQGDREKVDYDFIGRMDLSKLEPDVDLFLNDKDAEYYICGPAQFMTSISKGLRDLEIEPNRIKLEVFGTGGTSAI